MPRGKQLNMQVIYWQHAPAVPKFGSLLGETENSNRRRRNCQGLADLFEYPTTDTLRRDHF